MPKYSKVIVFTKKSNLLSYAEANSIKLCNQIQCNREDITHIFSRERDVNLLAMFRWETDGQYKTKCICRIRCPINPMPIKGEFEAISISEVSAFLQRNGWSYKETIFPEWFE